MGGAAVSAAAPVVWNFLGYHFQAGPLIVAVCATLMTRLIVSLNTNGPRRWALDVTVTALCVLVSALWVQANDLALLPAGLSGIMFGALGLGIISVAKSQAAAAFRAALQTFVRSLGAVKPPENPGG
jgi:hypothetical protein